MSRDNPLRQIPQLYGKARGVRPARWLSHSEASGQLIGACRDGTDLGLRDEALIRLGLAGMRAAEIFRLRVGDLRLHDAEARIEWVGKKRRARVIVPGPSLIATLDAMFDRWQQLLGRPLRPDEAVICCGKSGAGSGLLIPDQPIAQTSRCGRSSPAGINGPDSGTSLLTTYGEPPPGSCAGQSARTGRTTSTYWTSRRCSATRTRRRRCAPTWTLSIPGCSVGRPGSWTEWLPGGLSALRAAGRHRLERGCLPATRRRGAGQAISPVW